MLHQDSPFMTPLFEGLEETEKNRILNHLKSFTFQKNEDIITPGQVQRHLYFVEEGVQMSFFESGKKLHVMAFTYPPGICAIPESFTNQAPSEYFLRCLTPTKMHGIHFDDLQSALGKSHHLERTFRIATEQVLNGVLLRHRELHTLSMEERFRGFCKRSPHLLQTVPHKYIAAYLGIDPTNFSKLFNSVKF